MLRVVIHNWPNQYAIQILGHLREAAVPGKTRLLLVDFIAQYACKGTHPIAKDIPGSDLASAPEPLLPNFGKAFDLTFQLDIMCVTLRSAAILLIRCNIPCSMMAVMHGIERTIEDYVNITKESGWKIVQIYSPPDVPQRHILAEAV
jgi:hypothetical protein